MAAFNTILQLLTKDLKLDTSLGAFVFFIFVEEENIGCLLMWLTLLVDVYFGIING